MWQRQKDRKKERKKRTRTQANDLEHSGGFFGISLAQQRVRTPSVTSPLQDRWNRFTTTPVKDRSPWKGREKLYVRVGLQVCSFLLFFFIITVLTINYYCISLAKLMNTNIHNSK